MLLDVRSVIKSLLLCCNSNVEIQTKFLRWHSKSGQEEVLYMQVLEHLHFQSISGCSPKSQEIYSEPEAHGCGLSCQSHSCCTSHQSTFFG